MAGDVEDSIIFVHPTCSPTQLGDVDGPTRIHTYEVMQEEPFYKKWAGDKRRWSYMPYSMKMAGPREAVQHMNIRKNFGATHFWLSFGLLIPTARPAMAGDVHPACGPTQPGDIDGPTRIKTYEVVQEEPFY